MKTVKSRKINKKETKPAISFDKDEKKLETKEVKKRKVSEKSQNVSLEDKEVKLERIRRVKGRKLHINNFSFTFFVEKRNTLQKKAVVSDINEVIDQDDFEQGFSEDENFSIGFIILILAVCLVVGFIAGYMAYRLIFVP